MSKSRKRRSTSILNNIKNTTESALPTVGKGLTKIGVVAKVAAVKSVPIVEKGVSSIYGTLASGFNLGVKNAKYISNRTTKKKRSKRSRKTTI